MLLGLTVLLVLLGLGWQILIGRANARAEREDVISGRLARFAGPNRNL